MKSRFQVRRFSKGAYEEFLTNLKPDTIARMNKAGRRFNRRIEIYELEREARLFQDAIDVLLSSHPEDWSMASHIVMRRALSHHFKRQKRGK